MDGQFIIIPSTMSYSSSSSNTDSTMYGNKRKLGGILLKRQEAEERQRKYLLRLHDLKQQQQEQLYRSHLQPLSLSPIPSSSNPILFGNRHTAQSRRGHGDVRKNDVGSRVILDLLEDHYVEPKVERHMSLRQNKVENDDEASCSSNNDDADDGITFNSTKRAKNVMMMMKMTMPNLNPTSGALETHRTSWGFTAESDSSSSSPIPPPPRWNHANLDSNYFQNPGQQPRREQQNKLPTRVPRAIYQSTATEVGIEGQSNSSSQHDKAEEYRTDIDAAQPIVPLTRLVAASSSSSAVARSGMATITTLGSMSKTGIDELIDGDDDDDHDNTSDNYCVAPPPLKFSYSQFKLPNLPLEDS